jgi:hypothetical protein
MNIEQVTEYVACDGERFRDRAMCEKHEAMVLRINPIMDRLPKTHLEVGTYLQHDREVLRQVKRNLFAIAMEEFGDRYPKWKAFDADTVHPLSIVGRVLDDSGGPMNSAWARLACFDFDSGREYDQPYYVTHPGEAKEAVSEQVQA